MAIDFKRVVAPAAEAALNEDSDSPGTSQRQAPRKHKSMSGMRGVAAGAALVAVARVAAKKAPSLPRLPGMPHIASVQDHLPPLSEIPDLVRDRMDEWFGDDDYDDEPAEDEDDLDAESDDDEVAAEGDGDLDDETEGDEIEGAADELD